MPLVVSGVWQQCVYTTIVTWVRFVLHILYSSDGCDALHRCIGYYYLFYLPFLGTFSRVIARTLVWRSWRSIRRTRHYSRWSRARSSAEWKEYTYNNSFLWLLILIRPLTYLMWHMYCSVAICVIFSLYFTDSLPIETLPITFSLHYHIIYIKIYFLINFCVVLIIFQYICCCVIN